MKNQLESRYCGHRPESADVSRLRVPMSCHITRAGAWSKVGRVLFFGHFGRRQDEEDSMPWSNQGGGRGPWGQGPSGGGPQPPNLEELLKKGQDRFKRSVPGGFGGSRGIMLAILVAIAGVAAVTIPAPDRKAALQTIAGAPDLPRHPPITSRRPKSPLWLSHARGVIRRAMWIWVARLRVTPSCSIAAEGIPISIR